MRAIIFVAALVLGAASCGFDCDVKGELRPMAGCEALQQEYDAEQSRLDPPSDGEVLDDLLVCGAAHGCEIEP